MVHIESNSPNLDEMDSTSDTTEKIAVEMVYLAHNSLYEREKPYKLYYDPGIEIPRSNCTNKIYDSICVRDLRTCGESISFAVQGFTVLEMESKLKASDFYDEARVKDVYYPEIKDILRQFFGASRLEILEHVVHLSMHFVLMLAVMAHGSKIRKGHPAFPISTGEDYEFLQPTALVHTGELVVQGQYQAHNSKDFTEKSALEASRDVLKVDSDAYSRIQCVK